METKCLECGADMAGSKPHWRKKFCCKNCREENWRKNNRARLNACVRDYRARRYAKEGRWRDDGPKAKALVDWMLAIKSEPCSDCGGRFESCCMDFDHRDGTVKSYNVGCMFAHHYSRDLIESELKKCDLVCANCHRIRTRNRKLGSGKSAVRRFITISKADGNDEQPKCLVR